MKNQRGPSLTRILKRRLDGTVEVAVPVELLPLRLGQRVWFQAVDGRIEITLKPRGRRGLSRYSRRIRRGTQSRLHGA